MSDVTDKVKTFFSEDDTGMTPLQTYQDYKGRGFEGFKQTDRFVTIGIGQKAVLMYISKREAADYSVMVKLSILAAIAIFWIAGIWFTFLVGSELIASSFSPVILAIAIIILGPLVVGYIYLLIRTIPRIIFLIQNSGGQK